MTASRAQIGLIHGLAKKAGMSDEERRALMRRVAGVTSSAELTGAQAGRVIDELKAVAPARPAGAIALDGPYAGKLRALWITGHQLGVVRDRTDQALLAFVERQTGISHTRWLRDAGDARRVVEALKSWVARESGWVWIESLTEREQLEALIRAQWARAIALGMVPVAGPPDWALTLYAEAVVNRYQQVNSLAAIDMDGLVRVREALTRKIHALIASGRKGVR